MAEGIRQAGRAFRETQETFQRFGESLVRGLRALAENAPKIGRMIRNAQRPHLARRRRKKWDRALLKSLLKFSRVHRVGL